MNKQNETSNKSIKLTIINADKVEEIVVDSDMVLRINNGVIQVEKDRPKVKRKKQTRKEIE